MHLRKRIFAILLGTTLIANTTTVTLAKSNETVYNTVESTYTEKLISEKNQKEIDALYEKRQTLCSNFEKNKKQINSIDKEIIKLGARELTASDVMMKLQNSTTDGVIISDTPSINVNIPRESGVKWTSTRRQLTYSGTLFELQELRAVPTSSRGSLWGVASIKDTRKQNVSATNEFIKSIVPTVMGMIPNKIGMIGNGLSIYQACQTYNNNLSRNTKIEDIVANSTISVGSDYVLVYVKKVGYKDEGHQVLCYAGNNVSVAVTTVIPTLSFKARNNTYKVTNKTRNDNQTISSPKINNRHNTACSNYMKYLNKKSMNPHYNIEKFQIKLLGRNTKTIWVPKPHYGF